MGWNYVVIYFNHVLTEKLATLLIGFIYQYHHICLVLLWALCLYDFFIRLHLGSPQVLLHLAVTYCDHVHNIDDLFLNFGHTFLITFSLNIIMDHARGIWDVHEISLKLHIRTGVSSCQAPCFVVLHPAFGPCNGFQDATQMSWMLGAIIAPCMLYSCIISFLALNYYTIVDELTLHRLYDVFPH